MKIGWILFLLLYSCRPLDEAMIMVEDHRPITIISVIILDQADVVQLHHHRLQDDSTMNLQVVEAENAWDHLKIQ